MLRYFPLLALALVACTNDKPTLLLSVDEHQNLGIALERGDDHTFGTVHATVNGVDAGAAEIEKGSEGIKFSEASSPATASWTIALAPLESDAVHVVVTEDSDTFTMDVPTIGSARAPQLLTSLAQPIAPGDWIDLSSGVASDRVTSGFEVKTPDGDSCTTQWSEKTGTGTSSAELGIADNLQYDWWCGDYPAAGTLRSFTLTFDVGVTAEITKCTGDDLTCAPVMLQPLAITASAQIRF